MDKRTGLRFDNKFESAFDKEKIVKYTHYLVEWIRQKVTEANCKGCVVGISGGIDSALVVSLCAKAFPNNTLGIIMPIDNMNHDINDIKELEKNLQLSFKTVKLEKTYNELTTELKDINNQLSISNIKPRLRMTTLYAYAQEMKYLVVGTDNEDEYFIGYFTKHGDGGVDILPISRLLKSEVRVMANYLRIPETIINKKPSAGLWENQSDEDELGFSYYELDKYLMNDFNNISSESLSKIKKMNKINDHKRHLPPRPMAIDEFFKNN
ncbi:NAD(+) synthase [Mycoplasma sp. U97]|uniref:NAD(+) synthase n=1 Tax=Mycoplasma tauri TaxID=547987 RepID=UPI001CC099B7|nr:NAD(+) synthase [Mycoplasma tauri]MBZ4212691.1 NAD(+) synthase [Mycoplasma tauri]